MTPSDEHLSAQPDPSVCPRCSMPQTSPCPEWACGSSHDINGSFEQSMECLRNELTTELTRLRERNGVLERVAEAATKFLDAYKFNFNTRRQTLKNMLAALDHPAPQKP